MYLLTNSTVYTHVRVMSNLGYLLTTGENKILIFTYLSETFYFRKIDMSDPKNKRALPIYTVDAFADEPFQGNPAAVCLLPMGMVSFFFISYN